MDDRHIDILSGRGLKFGGLPVHVSAVATRRAPRFPDKPRTKRRLRRVRGKYGSWDHDKPAIFKISGALVMHPTIYHALKRGLDASALIHDVTEDLYPAAKAPPSSEVGSYWRLATYGMQVMKRPSIIRTDLT